MSDESVLVKDLPVEQNPGETDRTMIIGEDGRPRLSTLEKLRGVVGRDPRIGDLSNLETDNKTTVVAAINELHDLPLEKGTGANSVQTRHDDDPTNACVASGVDSLAFGARATATNLCSIAIGAYNRNVMDGAGPTCTGQQAIAFGTAAQATAHGGVAVGQQSKATGQLSFALGGGAEANAQGAYALGMLAKANGSHSHAFGPSTTANGKNQFVTGTRNIADDNDEFVLIVGNGTKVDDVETFSNAMTLDWNGNEVIAGKMTVGAAPTANMDVATKKYVDDASAPIGDLSNLKTDTKLSLVAAINELFDMIQALANPVVSISAQVQKGGLFIAPGDDYDTLSLYLTVTATYANGSRQEVRGYTLSGPDGHFVAGDNTITVTYQTKQTTVSVYIDEW